MSNATRDHVFTFSFETWADAQRRGMMRPPDRLLATLMASDQVDRLLVANPYRWLPTTAVRSVLPTAQPFPSTPDRVLVTPVRMEREDPVDLDALERSYRRYGSALRRAGARMGLADPSLVTVNPLVAGFGDLDWTETVTYYGRDDWLSSPAREAYWPAFREAYRRIAERGVAVAAVSQEIIDRMEPTGPHAVVPNGVEPAEWLCPKPAPPDWFAAIPGPRASYVGTLDSRLDIDGLVSLANARPELQIVLLGPIVDPPLLDPLRPLPNVTIRDHVGRAEVVAVLRNSDLCLVAHRRTALTAAMSPLKLYEYLAAGCPAISIDLPPVRGLGDRVLLVEAVSDFADVVDDALAAGPAHEADRIEFVQHNSWKARHTTILALHGSTRPPEGAPTGEPAR